MSAGLKNKNNDYELVLSNALVVKLTMPHFRATVTVNSTEEGHTTLAVDTKTKGASVFKMELDHRITDLYLRNASTEKLMAHWVITEDPRIAQELCSRVVSHRSHR